MCLLYARPLEDLVVAARSLLTDFGVDPGHADFVVNTLASASLKGIDTHGLELLPTYIAELRSGRSKLKPNISVKNATPSLYIVDADNALGVVAGNVAIRSVIAGARESGIAAAIVKNSNHFGPAGSYAEFAAKEGFIALVFSNADALVAADGGTVPLSGTNPIAFAAPGVGRDVFLLDMATSQVSYSRVQQTIAQQGACPSGWAIDIFGNDYNKSSTYAALKPLGGYKGQGLAMMVQILTALLANSPFDHHLSHFYSPPFDEPRQISHFFICIDATAFVPIRLFQERLTELLTTYRQSTGARGEPIVTPGDKETKSEELRSALGINVSSALLQLLQPYLPIGK